MIWAITCAVLATLVLAGFLVWRAHLRWRAQWRLRRLTASFERDGSRTELFTGLSRLMRDTAVDLGGDFPVAGMSGRRWLVFLDETGGTSAFTQGPGRHLTDAPYQDEPTLQDRDLDPHAVIAVCREWIRTARFNPERHR